MKSFAVAAISAVSVQAWKNSASYAEDVSIHNSGSQGYAGYNASGYGATPYKQQGYGSHNYSNSQVDSDATLTTGDGYGQTTTSYSTPSYSSGFGASSYGTSSYGAPASSYGTQSYGNQSYDSGYGAGGYDTQSYGAQSYGAGGYGDQGYGGYGGPAISNNYGFSQSYGNNYGAPSHGGYGAQGYGNSVGAGLGATRFAAAAAAPYGGYGGAPVAPVAPAPAAPGYGFGAAHGYGVPVAPAPVAYGYGAPAPVAHGYGAPVAPVAPAPAAPGYGFGAAHGYGAPAPAVHGYGAPHAHHAAPSYGAPHAVGGALGGFKAPVSFYDQHLDQRYGPASPTLGARAIQKPSTVDAFLGPGLDYMNDVPNLMHERSAYGNDDLEVDLWTPKPIKEADNIEIGNGDFNMLNEGYGGQSMQTSYQGDASSDKGDVSDGEKMYQMMRLDDPHALPMRESRKDGLPELENSQDASFDHHGANW